MNKPIIALLLMSSAISACSLSPDFTMPEFKLPELFKEQPKAEDEKQQGQWKEAKPLEKEDRGQWWKLYGDDKLNELEAKALAANPTLKAAAARVEQARGTVRANASTFLPKITLGANAVRAQPSSAGVAAFGGSPTGPLKPYTLYGANAAASYEVDLFGRVRDTEKALTFDADAADAMYKSVLLSLQADVAQNYFALRAIDTERALLRETVDVRKEAGRIMQKRVDSGEASDTDNNRAIAELAATEAELLALDRQRANLEHAMAVLLGELPSSFTMDEALLEGAPPHIPAGLPSSLLLRRPDMTAAQSAMAAANARVGVARTAFFPSLILTALGGTESVELSDLFSWSNRTWALGQLGGNALSMVLFDNGRTAARVDVAKATYDEAVENYRAQALVAFKEVEDNLADQRILAQQTKLQDKAATSAIRATDLIKKRYDAGDTDYFEVVEAERNSVAAARGAVQARGQRFITSVALIRALGGGWEEQKQP